MEKEAPVTLASLPQPKEILPSLEITNPFSGTPRLSLYLAVTLIVLYLAGLLVPSSINYLALFPGTASGMFFLSFLTSGFFEISAVALVLNVVAVLLFGKLLEPIWGSREFLMFVILVNVASAVATFLSIIVVYMFTLSDSLLYKYYWCGFTGMAAAFTVAGKQLEPEKEINILNIINFKTKYIPPLLLLFNIALAVVGLNIYSFPYVLFALFFSWVYLRFLQPHAGRARGDSSTSFTFASFFPSPIQAPIAVLSNTVFNCFKAVGICKVFGHNPLPPAASQIEPAAGESSDAERRRARAARALEKRLQQIERQETPPPSSSADALPIAAETSQKGEAAV